MPRTARRSDHFPLPAPSAAENWSGQVHGPVATMHQQIESSLRGQGMPLLAVGRTRPLDAIARTVSRLFGWTCLSAAYIAVVALIF